MMESFHTQEIRFLCEQDGEVEKELKSSLVALLRENVRIRKAYLARVRYEDSREVKVALCLREHGIDRQALVENVSPIFRSMFKTTESLDTIFLSAEQENKIAAVARPFYEQMEHKISPCR